jgi:hypothetical protein
MYSVRMAAGLEHRIRDYLAVHLDQLEPGLTLVRTEYPLKNPAGADARIDIVAKDRFGHFVVIEIKRHDKAARQALHEICKYTALFRIVHGLDHTHVRVMVVSTEWRELLVPLSECADSSQYSIEGFAIDATTDGSVTMVDRISLVPTTAGISLSREQGVYLFETKGARNAAVSGLVNSVETAQVKDFFVLMIDYVGNHQGVCYPFGIYLVFASPVRTLSAAEVGRLHQALDWDDELDAPDEHFLVAINRAFRSGPDSFEIGFPEKLTNIRRDWRISKCLRKGRLASPPSPLSDEELLSLAQAVDGGSPIYLHKLTSPKFNAAWRNLRRDIDQVLLGMPHWSSVTSAFLDEVEKSDPKATVSIAIYNPANLVMSLYTIASSGDCSHCPMLEVVVESDARSEVRVLAGVLMWNGTLVSDPAEKLIAEVYGGIDDWLMATQFHGTFAAETAALQAHGLLAPVVEFRFANGVDSGPQLVMPHASGIGRSPFAQERFMSLSDFTNSNGPYLSSLQRLVDSHVGGLTDSIDAG